MPDAVPTTVVPPKPGFLTSEFWLTLLGSLIGPSGFLIFMQDKLDHSGLAYAMVAAFIAASVPIFAYIKSRQAIKTQ